MRLPRDIDIPRKENGQPFFQFTQRAIAGDRPDVVRENK
jgi:hypothetical protein